MGTDEESTATRPTDPIPESPNAAALVAPQQPARLQPHRGITFVQETFPETFQLFEDLGESNSSLEQSVKGILVGMRTGGGAKQVINQRNEAGQTLAHLVGLYGLTSLWEELPMLGIDLNIVDNTDHTALDYAIANRGEEDRDLHALAKWLRLRDPAHPPPIVGAPESDPCGVADRYGVKGESVFTAFINMVDLSCRVCAFKAETLQLAVLHQQQRRHFQP